MRCFQKLFKTLSTLSFGQIHKHTLIADINHILSTRIPFLSPHQIPLEISCRTALWEGVFDTFDACRHSKYLGRQLGGKNRHFPSIHLPITNMLPGWAAMVNIFYSELTKEPFSLTDCRIRMSPYCTDCEMIQMPSGEKNAAEKTIL